MELKEIREALSIFADYMSNLDMESKELDNANTKIKEAVFWLTYLIEEDTQGESGDHGDGHQNDDHGVLQGDPEDGVTVGGGAIGGNTGLEHHVVVVLEADEDVFTAHGGVKEAGADAHEHGVQNETHEEQQEGQQEQIGCDVLLHHKTALLIAVLNVFLSQ